MLFVADLLHRAVLEERDVEAFGLHALQQAPEDALEGLREGPRPLEGLGKDEARRWDRNLHQTLEGSFLAVSKPIVCQVNVNSLLARVQERFTLYRTGSDPNLMFTNYCTDPNLMFCNKYLFDKSVANMF